MDVERFLEISEGMEHLVDDEYDSDDLLRAASLLAAAADKTGVVEVDMVVNLNSILGLNVITDDSTVNYVDFSPMDYSREGVYTKDVLVLQEELDNYGYWVDGHWVETLVPLCYTNGSRNPDVFTFDHDLLPLDHLYHDQDFEPASSNIAGFVQASDDSLRVIHFTHTYQIPSLR
ncbi:MAG: hypothetical protein E4G94_00500 [ANME-2 cluster archaeon]|nr:MAG: hypothetical protein E4G94_00500 [ANME-2 cluster archaeon]